MHRNPAVRNSDFYSHAVFLIAGIGIVEELAMPMASAWRRWPLGPLGIILTEPELDEPDQSFRHSQQSSSWRPQSRHRPWRHQKLDRQHSVPDRSPPPGLSPH